MSQEKKYDIFISYRRKDTGQRAEHLKDLLDNDYKDRISFDRENLTGLFDVELARRIDTCVDFLLLIDEKSLVYTAEDNSDENICLYNYLATASIDDFEAKINELGPEYPLDFVRIEIARALHRRDANIIPIVPETSDKFNFAKLYLPKDIVGLKRYDAIFFSKNKDSLFKDILNKLRHHLKTPKTTKKVISAVDSVVYKIRVDRKCTLFIDDEYFQDIEANKLTKISLPKGEYLRKVVDIEDESVYAETEIQLIEGSKLDDVQLNDLFKSAARVKAQRAEEEERKKAEHARQEEERIRKEKELQERMAQAEAEKKALEEKMRIAEEKARQAEEKARQAEERRKAEEKRQAEARKEAEEEANQTERRRKAEELTREYFLWKQQSEKKQPIGVSRMSTHGLSNANIKKVNDKCDNLAEHLSYEYNDANMTATVTGHKLSSDVIGCINIPEKVIYKGKYYTVNQIGKNAFFYCSSLTSVLIPNTVTTIGVQAFNKCTSLKSVTISKCLNSIGWRAFCGCKSLTSIVLPNSLMTIEDEAFSGCSSLQSIFIPAGQKVRFLRMKGLQYYERLLVDSKEQCKALELEESIISIDDLRSKAYAYFSRRNYSEAVKWYRQAAELGDPFSQYTLANLYVDGHGVDKNLTEAKKWYQKAAEHGHAEAIKKIYELGTIAESKQSIKGYDNSKSVDVILKSAGVNKLQVVKTIKEQTGYGLKESKDIVDAAPTFIKRNVDKVIAERIKKELEELGAIVELHDNSTTFDVVLKSAGVNKLQVVKTIKEQTGYGLKESKDIVDAAPTFIKRNVDKVIAERIKKELEEFSAIVELNDNSKTLTAENSKKIFTVNGVSFKMIAVQGGIFTMGATSEQGSEEPFYDEIPAHQVILSNYMIGETEVTQELWQAVMGSNPSYFQGKQNPVEQVSWDVCQEFVKKLNQMTGMQFRLPTEAEWEYAARGGNKSRGYRYAGNNNLDEVAWHDKNSGRRTHPIKQKQANELGLYDMSGNVMEWCQDWYGNYSSSAQTNPKGPASGSRRVYRGGGWCLNAGRCRVSFRYGNTPTLRLNSLGFRLAL